MLAVLLCFVLGAAASSPWFVATGGDAQRSSRVASIGPHQNTPPSVVFNAGLGNRIYTGRWQIMTPDANEIVFASSVFESADLHRVDASTGKLLSWSHTGERFQGLTALNASSSTVLACQDDRICSLAPEGDASKGFVQRWCTKVGYAGGALVAGNVTFQWPSVDNYYSNILDTDTGASVAQFAAGTAGAALSSDGSLFFNGISGFLQAVDRTGARVWLVGNTSWPIVDSLRNDSVYARRRLPGQQYALVQLDPRTGKQQWSVALQLDGFDLNLAVGWKSLFVSARGGRDLVSVDPTSGKVLWNLTMPGDQTIAVSVVDGQDTVYCSTNVVTLNGNATIVAVDGAAGRVLWRLPLYQINDVQAMMLDHEGNIIVQRSNSVMKLSGK
jgi:outer membrane protein assembly factor BamB